MWSTSHGPVYDPEEERQVGPLPVPLDAQQPIAQTGLSLGEFWRWAYSDVLSNAMRGCLGEYLVATALGLSATPRVEWDAVDLRLSHDAGIFAVEVKTSSYFQSWPLPEGRRRAHPTFGFSPRRRLQADTGELDARPARWADVYVFAHYLGPGSGQFDEVERRQAVLDAGRWAFYVGATEALEQALEKGSRQVGSVSLARLEQLAGDATIVRAGYQQLGTVVLAALPSTPRLSDPIGWLAAHPRQQLDPATTVETATAGDEQSTSDTSAVAR